jgi:hypothetical protein
MSAHTINQLATWMIEHPCIDSEVVEGREEDSGRSSMSDILLCRAQVILLVLGIVGVLLCVTLQTHVHLYWIFALVLAIVQ